MSSRDVFEEPVEYRARLIGDALKSQALLIAVTTVLGALLGYGASLARPGSYVATATVLINPLSGNPYSPGVTGQDSLVSIETESKVATSDSVSALVGKKLDEANLSKLEKGVTASVPSNTTVILVTFASANATFARDAAQAYVDSFLTYRAERAQAVNAAQAASLQKQQDTVKSQLQDTQAKVVENGSSAYYDQLIKTYNAQVVSLQSQISALGAQKPDAGRVISPAATPHKTSGLGRPLYLVGGALFGLLGGLALALARQRRDDRVLHVDEIDSAGIPVMAVWSSAVRQAAEATRSIRARVLEVRKSPTVIAVGPSRETKGHWPVAGALAESLANVGRNVVLADLVGDFSVATDDTARHGVTDLLTGRRSSLRDLLVKVDDHLTVLPKGRADLGDAVEFLDAARMRKLIGALPNDTDFVVVQTPSLTDSVGETLMDIANLSVVTVTLARTTRSELAVVKSRGGDRVGACVTPRLGRRFRKTTRRSRREGSTQETRTRDGLKLLGDGDGDEEIPA